MASVQHIGQHRFSLEDRLLFDTNIWISLFNCRSDPDKQEDANFTKIYAGALKRTKTAQSQLFIHPLIASEFVNRMVHDEHKFLRGLNQTPRDFKAWRHSSQYQPFAAVVASQARNIIQNCRFVEHSFDAASFERCLSAFEEDPRDLNDELLLEICESCNLKLVTHDGDFGHTDVAVLSANPKYFR